MFWSETVDFDTAWRAVVLVLFLLMVPSKYVFLSFSLEQSQCWAADFLSCDRPFSKTWNMDTGTMFKNMIWACQAQFSIFRTKMVELGRCLSINRDLVEILTSLT